MPVSLLILLLVAKHRAAKVAATRLQRGLYYLIAAEFTALLCLAVLGFRYEQHARRVEAALFYPPGRLLNMGGYRLHLYCTGSGGPTVILEHGHRATDLDWYLVQPQLATFTRVCSYDRAGYGWSDASPKPRLPSVMADELNSLLRSASEKPPYILVAHSYGSFDALMFAHKFPNQVAGLVLVDATTATSLPRISWRTKLWFGMMRLTMPFGLPRWRGWCGGGPPATAALKQALTCRSRYYETIAREESEFPQSAEEIRRITSLDAVPLVVIARDPATGHNLQAEARHQQQQREFLKLSRNSRFLVAGRSGHDIPLARPDVIVDAVKMLVTPQVQADTQGIP